jgi:hypothetical protein
VWDDSGSGASGRKGSIWVMNSLGLMTVRRAATVCFHWLAIDSSVRVACFAWLHRNTLYLSSCFAVEAARCQLDWRQPLTTVWTCQCLRLLQVCDGHEAPEGTFYDFWQPRFMANETPAPVRYELAVCWQLTWLRRVCIRLERAVCCCLCATPLAAHPCLHHDLPSNAGLMHCRCFPLSFLLLQTLDRRTSSLALVAGRDRAPALPSAASPSSGAYLLSAHALFRSLAIAFSSAVASLHLVSVVDWLCVNGVDVQARRRSCRRGQRICCERGDIRSQLPRCPPLLDIVRNLLHSATPSQLSGTLIKPGASHQHCCAV